MNNVEYSTLKYKICPSDSLHVTNRITTNLNSDKVSSASQVSRSQSFWFCEIISLNSKLVIYISILFRERGCQCIAL